MNCNKCICDSTILTFDNTTNYQEMINIAKRKNDFKSASIYEVKRNAKIANMNACGNNWCNFTPTYNYTAKELYNN